MTIATLANMAPAAVRPPLLCVVCGRPRTWLGLARCKPCLREAADANTNRAPDTKPKARKTAATAHQPAPKGRKTCRTCAKDEPMASFDRHGTAKDGRRRDCQACVEARRRLIAD
jgi:hypothetical protein